MRKFDTKVQYLKYKVLREVVRLAYADELLEHVTDIPKTIIPGKIPTMRCCVYKERAILSERVKLAMGGDRSNPNVIEVLDIACDECPMSGHVVTEACRGCIAHRCEDACKRGAITFDAHQKAHIDKSKCVECGACAKVCPYGAIADQKRPCERACKVKAISRNEDGSAHIDNDKCISCGACVYQCPFGAIADKSFLLDVIALLRGSDGGQAYKVYAVVAPSISSQFVYAKLGQVIEGLHKLGFYHVVEAALGADMVAYAEAAELAEKGFLTSSCCPAFVDYIHKQFPTLVEHISHNLSPAATIAQYLKKTEPGARVVFIGPCTAKKMEFQQERVRPYIDSVITFEELQALFDGAGVDITTLGEGVLDNASYYGRIFARSGGLSDAVAEALKEQGLDATFEARPIACDGIEACRAALLCDVVCELQAVVDLPLQIDTSNPAAMEAALRRYNGKALLNSVNGKQESLHSVLPLARKYGALVVALTLDEDGIPATADGRVRIAEKILRAATAYGLGPEDLLFDPLAMTVSADAGAALVTLEAVRRIGSELGCHTSLGISNVSFGLPARDAVNATFFACALENGLSAAILNPHSADMRRVYYAFRALHGQDADCADYIAFAAGEPARPAGAATQETETTLRRAIERGLRERAGELTQALLQTTEPLELVKGEIIPALDVVGQGFERGTVYLPQLLMSAEAAKSAFERIRVAMSAQRTPGAARCRVVLATVHGDIHDIGKNIVKLLLENYGFAVTDLGRDVPPERVVEEVVRLRAPLLGLSALMTTTVPAMEETIRQVRAAAPWCRIVVGGAVLNEGYAARIGADRYAADAMETVRYAEGVDGAPPSEA